MKNTNKEQGSITIALDSEIWKMFDEVHSEVGISKSKQAKAILKGMIKNKSDILFYLKDEILSKRDALLEQALELENLAKGNQSEINRLDSLSSKVEDEEVAIVETSKPKMKRANTNALVFTQDSVDGLRPQDKDVWFHDIQTKGLAIRSKKDGMTYYTRAKNEKLSKYCFETDGLSVYEISRKIQIADKGSLPRSMSIQNTIYQICKAIYHFGSKEDKAIVFGDKNE
jgi:hypothetical protein